ncbi:hypothetical protein RB195_001803 [Necator americanus]
MLYSTVLLLWLIVPVLFTSEPAHFEAKNLVRRHYGGYCNPSCPCNPLDIIICCCPPQTPAPTETPTSSTSKSRKVIAAIISFILYTMFI